MLVRRIRFVGWLVALSLPPLTRLPAGSADVLTAVEQQIARRYSDTNAVPAALATLRTAVKESPADVPLWTALSRSCYLQATMTQDPRAQLPLYQEGIAAGRQAVALDTNSTQALLWTMANLGRTGEMKGVLNAIGVAREVGRLIDRMLALDPDFVPGLQAKANYYWQMPRLLGGNTAVSVRCLERALALKPRDGSLWLDLARIRRDRGEKAAAAECLRKVLDLNLDDPEYRKEIRPEAEQLAREWAAGR